jgi:hypothetical protein
MTGMPASPGGVPEHGAPSENHETTVALSTGAIVVPRGMSPDSISLSTLEALAWTFQHEDHVDPWHPEQ